MTLTYYYAKMGRKYNQIQRIDIVKWDRVPLVYTPINPDYDIN